MKDTPQGWPRISSAVFYDDAAAAIPWLCKAFGFTVRLEVKGEAGRIEHSELEYGEGLVMVGNSGGKSTREKPLPGRSPKGLNGANTQSLCVFVDDVDAHAKVAKAAGATIVLEPTTNDYGPEYWSDRSYGVLDLEGHMWFFMQRMSTKGIPA
ncbi:MAG: VOC family protein [Polyangiaceae bacterium]